MKLKYSKLTVFLLSVSLGFVGCKEKEDPITEDKLYTISTDGNTKTITGTVNEDLTLENDYTWKLSGGIFVADGSTLTVEEGTIIKSAADGTIAFLAVQRGGKISANGTASNPIVFTSGEANPSSGDWGGIIVNGNAPINTGATAEGEGGTGIYGGTNASDNSGVIRYVRVEYAGKILGTDNELNGFSFNGVGSGTTVEYVQAYNGSDDGFEFFGGTVNVRYAVSSGNEDDSFDWTHGWSGKGQFWVVNQFATGGDRGIEADNNGDDNTAAPYSNPTLSNITLIGLQDSDSDNTGMRLREGTKGKIYNAIVTNFPKNGIRVSDPITTANMTAGDLMVSNSVSFNNGTDWKDCAEFENDASNNSNAVALNGFVGTTTGGFDVSTSDNWFVSTNFIGAVETSNDWTAGWIKN
ncbi:MAG: hypothetical protein ACI8ZO_000344 [Flavobacteriales bacterium]|jgi:hypothetical protein